MFSHGRLTFVTYAKIIWHIIYHSDLLSHGKLNIFACVTKVYFFVSSYKTVIL